MCFCIYSVEKSQNNIAFTCFYQLGDTASCVDILLKTGRAPEAAIFARTYAPSSVHTAVESWKSTLSAAGKSKLADGIADPENGDEDLFEEGWQDVLSREKNGSHVNGSGADGETYSNGSEVHVGSNPVGEVVENLTEKVKELVVGSEEDSSGKCTERKGSKSWLRT